MLSFNPCFIGTYSFTKYKKFYKNKYKFVLILVLLELILLQNIHLKLGYNVVSVLILVLLELILLLCNNSYGQFGVNSF